MQKTEKEIEAYVLKKCKELGLTAESTSMNIDMALDTYKNAVTRSPEEISELRVNFEKGKHAATMLSNSLMNYDFHKIPQKGEEQLHEVKKQAALWSDMFLFIILKIQDKVPTQKLNEKKKLLWKGTPGQLALIVDVLIEKGYLEATPFGERSAELLISAFDFEDHAPTKESLGKLLHKDSYPIKDKTVIDRFNKIPYRNELKK